MAGGIKQRMRRCACIRLRQAYYNNLQRQSGQEQLLARIAIDVNA